MQPGFATVVVLVHPSADDFEGQVLSSANLRTDQLMQDCKFVGTIEADEITAASDKGRRRRWYDLATCLVVATATIARHVAVREVGVIVALGFGGHELISGFGKVKKTLPLTQL